MNELSLRGIDGQHLWGFLAALGSLSLLDQHARKRRLSAPRIAFSDDGSAVLYSPVAREELASTLLGQLQGLKSFLGNDLGQVNRPGDFTRANFDAIALGITDPIGAGLLSGLACVVGETTSESTLCAANGASHQNLVQSMRDVLALVEEEHVRLALFDPWKRTYVVPQDKRKALSLGTRKPTLRLDPSDERLYALRLSNPTTTDDYATELGAQVLAIPSFGLLPVVASKHPLTVASSRSGGRVTFSWPLWNAPATLSTVRSLVWAGAGRPDEQRRRGVFAAFSADRVTGAKGKLSFAPSRGVW